MSRRCALSRPSPRLRGAPLGLASRLPLPAGRAWLVWLVCLVCLGWLAACDAPQAEEARGLLAALHDLEVDGPLATRRAQLERLGAMPLSSPPVRAARAACVAAHGRLLESEVLQAEVKQGLSNAGQSDSGQSKSAEPAGEGASQRQHLQMLLARSETLRAQGLEALPACRDQTRALAKRFRL